jgi:hypothetical protein
MMPAVAERPPARAVVEELRARYEELAAEAEKVQAELVLSPAREAEARRVYLGQKGQHWRPGAVSPITQVMKDREQLERRQVNLQANMDTLAELIRDAEQAGMAERRQRVDEEAVRLQVLFRDAVRVMGDRFSDLHDAYLAVREAAEALDAFRHSPETVAVVPNHLEWLRVGGHFPVHPLPVDFGAWLSNLLEVTVDPAICGYREGTRYDDSGELPNLTPDLRRSPPTRVSDNISTQTLAAPGEFPAARRRP